MTTQQAAYYFARRYLALSPAEWDALPPEVRHVCLTQLIGDDD